MCALCLAYCLNLPISVFFFDRCRCLYVSVCAILREREQASTFCALDFFSFLTFGNIGALSLPTPLLTSRVLRRRCACTCQQRP
jgi:hypothetical protein